MASWICPYCGQMATHKAIISNYGEEHFHQKTKLGAVVLSSLIELCPNEDCNEIVITAKLSELEVVEGRWGPRKLFESWTLRPAALVKIFPEYIPKAILED